MDLLDVTLRLGAATLAGAAFGLNRDLHGKPTGVRTLGLVGLGSALAVMAAAELGDAAAASRVMQGIVTGIGFLGAGVIVRAGKGFHIHGLTTAATTWLTACVGIVCAAAAWRIVAVGLVLALVVLVCGGPFEKWVHRQFPGHEDEAPPH
jgi:putative Mg2+ transporter-C (MgtC) family protein